MIQNDIFADKISNKKRKGVMPEKKVQASPADKHLSSSGGPDLTKFRLLIIFCTFWGLEMSFDIFPT